MEKVKNFVQEVQIELKKTSWPTVKELKESTIVIIIATLLFGAFIGAVDFVLKLLITLVIR